MELKGKKIAFLGDSITAGSGTSDPATKPYWYVLGQLSGAQCIGYGCSGHRLARQYASEDNGYIPFVERVDTMDADANVVVVFGGTNDFGHGDAPFGCMSDRTPDTFCGAVHHLCLALINRYPTAQLVFLTPLHRTSEDGTALNDRGLRHIAPLEDYVDTILDITAYYGIPALDLFRTSGLQPKVPVLRERYMPDGLHPNDEGHVRLAKRLLGFLQAL